MTSAAPTVLAIEGDSAWIVMLAVSSVTLLAVLVLRRMIRHPGGLASGLLLCLPLILPLIAAVSFDHAALPVVAVLRPMSAELMTNPTELLHVLFISNDKNVVTAYALYEMAGAWMLWIGLSVSSLMLLRRLIGTVMVGRLIRHSRPLAAGDEGDITMAMDRLVAASSLSKIPAVLVMPEGSVGAFAVAGRGGRILISPELLRELDRAELEGILAHEIAHLEAKDVPLTFSAGFLRDLVAWNPLAHIAYRGLVADREVEADHRAVALTGDPLSVASGLVRLCELRGRHRMRRPFLALAFGGGRVPRRVSSLLALADGGAAVRTGSSVPYLVAGLLVAVIGLQAGAQVASQDAGAHAIMLGWAHETSQEYLWSPATKHSERKAVKQNRAKGKRIPAAQVPTDPIAFKAKFKHDWIQHWKRKSRKMGLAHETQMWDLLQMDVFPGFYRLSPGAI